MNQDQLDWPAVIERYAVLIPESRALAGIAE